jgi:hypothetical protein
VGLVFFGAATEVCERAARFFVQWVGRWGRELSIVGGYERQSSIGYVGEMVFVRYTNGAKGWYRKDSFRKEPVAGTEERYGEFVNRLEEVRVGIASSYVYFPCAE